MRKILLTNFLFLITYLSFSQRFGSTPPSVKWMQVNTDTARVIFPAGLDSQAQRIASIIHHLAAQKPVSLGDKLYKIDIVLQNQTTIPNGYVGLGPYRSEFYLNPVLNNFSQGTISWGDQLSLHEYRHVQQFNNFRRGLSQVMYTLFGQEGYALAVNASVPDWFYEGDAVYNETVLTKQGRGRLPFFVNAYPSLWYANKDYSWMKLRNGSLKDYVPSHYSLGYLLVNYGREKYGLDFWSKVTKDAAAFKGLFYPFQKAIKRHAGVDYKTFYNDAFAYYKVFSRADLPRDTVIKAITPVNERVVTNYLFPYRKSANSLVYVKTSYDKRPAFYIKDETGERRIRIRDISIDDQFSYRNGKIVYAAYENDSRWGWRDYSVIKILDIETGKQTILGGKKGYYRDPITNISRQYVTSPKAKYFTPDISEDGTRIAAVQVNTDGKSVLHIMKAENGEVVNEIKSADISLFTDPKFIDQNTLICIVRLTDGRSALAIANIETGSIERLTPPTYSVVGYPCVNNGNVYFTAAYRGNDDLYSLRLSDKKMFRVTNAPLGNYFVNAAHGKITWSNFTAEGYQLQQMDEKDLTWTPMDIPIINEATEQMHVSYGNEGWNSLLATPAVTDRKFGVSKYRKGTRLINFHSWRPYYEDPEYTFSIYGENTLNTTQTQVYYLYNENEKTHAGGFNFIFGGWFPYLSIGTQYTFNRQQAIGNDLKRWNQLDSRIGFNIPLSWVRGKTISQMNFGSNYVYRHDFNRDSFKAVSNIKFSYLSHFFSWGQQVERAVQHFYPRLGYNVSLNFRHAITKYTSWQPLMTGAVYLPGVLNTHNIVLTGAFQETDTVNVLFGNRFPYSRGYNEGYFSRMWRVSGNYHLPLVYPDFGFANILYFQRVRTNLFFDFTRVYSLDKTAFADQRSVGGELFLDTKWWNQYELTFGFRVSRLLDNDFFNGTKGTVFEFILPVSIIPR